MAAINNDWLDALKGEFSKPYYKKLFETVNQEYRTHRVYPPADDIFNAFHLTPLKDVKVVILGQDPYHGDGQAEGLSFSVKPGVVSGVYLSGSGCCFGLYDPKPRQSGEMGGAGSTSSQHGSYGKSTSG